MSFLSGVWKGSWKKGIWAGEVREYKSHTGFSGCHVEKKVYHDRNGYRLRSRRVCTYAVRCWLNFRFIDRKCHWWIPWHMGSLQALWINRRFSNDDSWSLKDNYPDPALSTAPEEYFKEGSRLAPPVSGYWDGIVKWYRSARSFTSCCPQSLCLLKYSILQIVMNMVDQNLFDTQTYLPLYDVPPKKRTHS